MDYPFFFVFWLAAIPISEDPDCPSIFVFLVTKHLQLFLWDLNLMNLIDLFIDLCWVNKIEWGFLTRCIIAEECCVDFKCCIYIMGNVAWQGFFLTLS